MQLIITERPDERKINLTMEPTDALSDLKDKLRSFDKRYQDFLMLIHDHENLEDDAKKLQDYGIKDNSTIDLYYSFQFLPIYLDIESFAEKSFKLYFDPATVISDVKKYLEDTFKVAPNQLLISCHEILEDSKKLNQYYKFSSPIFLCPPPSEGQKVVIIKNFEGKFHLIQIGASEKVKDLKTKIQSIENLNVEKQRLLFKDTYLEDEKTIQDCSLPEFPIILLAPHVGGENIDITITYLTGKKLQLKVDSKDTIATIKILVNFIDQHPINMQCLSFNEIDLDDDQKTLESYSIGNGANINIVLHYRG